MRKILFLAPHLSTGGMPQYLYEIVKNLLIYKHDVYVIEYSHVSDEYIVQRDRIIKLIGNRLITFYDSDEIKKKRLLETIKDISPDIIHFQEFPEFWLNDDVCEQIYKEDKEYKIIETSHDSSFSPDAKRFFPDGFAFISNFHPPLYERFEIPIQIVEYPISYQERPDRESSLIELGLDPSYKHVLNVGLFTPRKNQKEIFEIAKQLEQYKIKFHFVGNQAPNFQGYWEPLMQNKPNNCIIWGERNDVEKFYAAMDLFLFTSKGTVSDRETNPLVIKEAIGWKMPVCIYNLPVYQGMYDNKENVFFLEENIQNNCEKVLSILDIPVNKDAIIHQDVFTANLSVDNDHFKIDFQPKQDLFLGSKCWAVMKDMETELNIYGFYFECRSEVSFFCLSNLSCQYISGIIFEIYDPDFNLIFSKKMEREDGVILEKNKDYGKLSHMVKDFCYDPFVEIIHREDYTKVKKINQGDVVVDFGANIGIFSLYALKNGASKVYSIEPSSVFLNLEKNLSNYHERSVRFNFAIGDSDESAVLYAPHQNSCMNTISNTFFSRISSLPHSEEEIFMVDVNTFFDKYVEEQKIDYLKMDIEGKEYDVLEHLDEEILSSRIECIGLEYHFCDEVYNRSRFMSIVEKLERCGFECFYNEEDRYRKQGILIANKKRELDNVKSRLRIIQLPPGKLPVPPNGWGAIEEIIYQYQKEISKREGYECSLNSEDINTFEKRSIIQIYAPNQALEFQQNKIPYVFSPSDTTPVIYGKQSSFYYDNLKAINGSVFSVFPSQYYKNYFKDAKRPCYQIPQGVDINFFEFNNNKREKKLLCLGKTDNFSDIMIADDRKGFLLSLETAKKMNIPITLAGPNSEFLETYEHFLNYEKLTIIDKNLSKEEVRDLYSTHSILMHLSTIESGCPTLCMLESLSCGTPVIASYLDEISIEGMLKSDRNIFNIELLITEIFENFENYSLKARSSAEKYSWAKVVDRILYLYNLHIQELLSG